MSEQTFEQYCERGTIGIPRNLIENDFRLFQETVRELSLLREDGSRGDWSEPYFYNGWSSIRAMRDALRRKDSLFVSPSYVSMKFLLEHMLSDADYSKNVRGVVKKILMYPRTGFAPFLKVPEEYNGDKILEYVQKNIRPKNLEVRENKIYLNLHIPEGFHNIISDFVGTQSEGWDATPHITVINSNEYELFKSETEAVENFLSTEIDDVTFTSLGCTFDMVYPPYKCVIVAECNSDKLSNAVDILDSSLSKSGMFKKRKLFHFTIWVKPRVPSY